MARKYKLIQSLSRAFSIIDCFNEREQELTLNTISNKVELNINTTRGLVQTLLHYNYLSYDEENNKYRLGLVYMEKAEIAQFDFTEKIIQLIRGDLQKIADKYSISSRFLSIDNLNTTTIIERRPSRSRYVLAIHDQTDFPLYASATGKLILSNLSDEQLDEVLSNIKWESYGKNTIMDRETLETHLTEIKEDNLAYESEELGEGYSSIAIPIFRDKDLAFSISSIGTTQLILDNTESLISDMKQVKEKIYEKIK